MPDRRSAALAVRATRALDRAPLPGIPVVPAVPGLPDPLRRFPVPRDLDAVTTVGDEADPADAGMTRDGVERIWSAARRLYRTGVHPAIQLTLRREGHVVLDRAIGHAVLGSRPEDAGRERALATPDTPFCIFSASKAVLAVVVHHLAAQGAFALDDPISDYLPEWDRTYQRATTIHHVLAHQAGLPVTPGELIDLDRLEDTDWILNALRTRRPTAAPGRQNAYHALTGGFILAEIVERATGRTIQEVLAEDITGPVGIEGLRWGTDDAGLRDVAVNYVTGPHQPFPVGRIAQRALGLPPDDVTRISNDPRFLRGVVPAGNIVATAATLTRFFELLRRGGELDGTRVLDPRTIRRAIAETTYHRLDRTLVIPIRYSAGFMLGARVVSLYGPETEDAFGHLGYMNVIAWADPQRGLSGTLNTSGKPIVHQGVVQLWDLMRRIGIEAPDSPDRPLGPAPTAATSGARAAA